MNLQSSILRDGTKVHYLNIPEPVEAKPQSNVSQLIKKVGKKILRVVVGNPNKTNKRRSIISTLLKRRFERNILN